VLHSITGLIIGMVSWSSERALKAIGDLMGFAIGYVLFRFFYWLCEQLGFVGSFPLGLLILAIWFLCVCTRAGA